MTVRPAQSGTHDGLRFGIIADTHGLLRPEAREFLRGCDSIIHAGDIGNAGILAELARLAPVSVIRGNVDKGAWGESLPEAEFLQLGALFVYVIHDLAHLDFDPKAAGISVTDPMIRIDTPSYRDDVVFCRVGFAG